MTSKLRMQAIAMLEFDAASLTTSFQTIAAAGIAHEVQIFKMFNASDIDVIVSYDGSESNDFIQVSGGFILDCTANAEKDRAALAKGQQVWVKAASAGIGTIYVIGYGQRRG